MLKALQHIYQNTEMQLTLNGKMHSHDMSTKTGVKKGCPLSPLLFDVYIEQLHKELQTFCSHLAGTQIGEHNLLDILYADEQHPRAPKPDLHQAGKIL